MIGLSYERVAIVCLLLVVLAQIVFSMFPHIDIAVSHLFADGAAGFSWADGPIATVNLVIRRIGEAVAFLLVIGCLIGALAGWLRSQDLRAWAYLALCVLTSTGIVNLILKAHIGRARPNRLVEFGGTAQFSPPWQLVRECSSNCSFTSGEVAMAAGLAIPAVVLLWHRLASRKSRVVAVVLAASYVAFVALLRIGLGRHFLSDAVFSILIASVVALALYPVLRIETARQSVNLAIPALPLRRWIADRQSRALKPRKGTP